MIKLGIFASGSGSNAENFCKFFTDHEQIAVAKIYTNNASAGVIARAHRLDCAVQVFTKDQLQDGRLLDQLKQDRIDAIILAGYLQLIPESLINAYPNRMINIHPALLPAYGGKGMYGNRVHQAVIANGEKRSGITIHLVNEEYDKGQVLFQAECLVSPDETAETLAQKIHQLEYEHFPEAVADYLLS